MCPRSRVGEQPQGRGFTGSLLLREREDSLKPHGGDGGAVEHQSGGHRLRDQKPFQSRPCASRDAPVDGPLWAYVPAPPRGGFREDLCHRAAVRLRKITGVKWLAQTKTTQKRDCYHLSLLRADLCTGLRGDKARADTALAPLQTLGSSTGQGHADEHALQSTVLRKTGSQTAVQYHVTSATQQTPKHVRD